MANIDQSGNGRRRLSKSDPKLKSLKSDPKLKSLERAKRQTPNKTIHDTKFGKWASISDEAIGQTYKKGRTKFWLEKEWDPAAKKYITAAKISRKAWGRKTTETYDLETGNRIEKERIDGKGQYGVRYWPNGSRRIRHQSARSNRNEEIEVLADGNVRTWRFTLKNYSETRTRNYGGPEIREVKNGDYHLKESIDATGSATKLYEKNGALEEKLINENGKTKRIISKPDYYHEMEIDEDGETFTTKLIDGNRSFEAQRFESGAVHEREMEGGKLVREFIRDGNGEVVLNNWREIRKGSLGLTSRETHYDKYGNTREEKVRRPFYRRDVDATKIERTLFGRTSIRPTANMLKAPVAQGPASTPVPTARQAPFTPGPAATQYSPVPPLVPPKIPLETRPPASQLPPEGQVHSTQDPSATPPPVPLKIPLTAQPPAPQLPLEEQVNSTPPPAGASREMTQIAPPPGAPRPTLFSLPLQASQQAEGHAATQYPLVQQPSMPPDQPSRPPWPPSGHTATDISQVAPGPRAPLPIPVPLPGTGSQQAHAATQYPRPTRSAMQSAEPESVPPGRECRHARAPSAARRSPGRAASPAEPGTRRRRGRGGDSGQLREELEQIHRSSLTGAGPGKVPVNQIPEPYGATAHIIRACRLNNIQSVPPAIRRTIMKVKRIRCRSSRFCLERLM